ncbi:TadE/TadG family type IV pilus assembly protein [Blastococcus haudaquaticus]|uniref:TadE-like protein n=1 Tax=Blastococcus haudaquaticus TaxID=1938745 RepID=A0A286H5A4_9ACTN|nr:TadE/TadG family type IV pilus assembly protein [Blastococcus haudaquaticus]SOE02941.1 TadE-like protein [Blastococcus haudaquaticus]
MSVRSRAHLQYRRRVAARLLGERGAAAVEFALVAPVLILLVLGIIEFSKVYNSQSTLSAAAREGARVMALTNDVTEATAAVRNAATGLELGQIQVTPTTCTGAASTATVTVTVAYHQPFVAGFLNGAGVDLSGEAVMRCGG